MDRFTRGYLSLNNVNNEAVVSKLKELGLDCFDVVKVNDKVFSGVLVNGKCDVKSADILEKIGYVVEAESYDFSSIEDDFVSDVRISGKYFFIIRVKFDERIFDYFKDLRSNGGDEFLGLRTVEDGFVAFEKSSGDLKKFDLLIEDLIGSGFEVDKAKSLVLEVVF